MPIVLTAAAVVFTGGAALGIAPLAGGWGAAAGSIGSAIGGSGAVGGILGGAITQAGYGGMIGLATGGVKGMKRGVVAGAVSGGVMGGLGMETDPLKGAFGKSAAADPSLTTSAVQADPTASFAKAASDPVLSGPVADPTLGSGAAGAAGGGGGAATAANGLLNQNSATAGLISGIGDQLSTQASIKQKYKGEMKLQMQEQDYWRKNYQSGARGLLVGDFKPSASSLTGQPETETSDAVPEPVTADLAQSPNDDAYMGGRYEYDASQGRIVFKRANITGAPTGYV